LSPYRIALMSPDGLVQEERIADFDHDDQAIDATGKISHPHQIQVYQGERLVGTFQPIAGFRPNRWLSE
jgi:hypothetical protein